jgi:hypothetical protein
VEAISEFHPSCQAHVLLCGHTEADRMRSSASCFV